MAAVVAFLFSDRHNSGHSDAIKTSGTIHEML